MLAGDMGDSSDEEVESLPRSCTTIPPVVGGKRGAPTPPSGALAQKAAAGSPVLINVLHLGPRGASKAAASGQPTARPSRRPLPTATQQAMAEAVAQKAEN